MDFTQPWDFCDVTFIVEDKPVYVSKAVLALSSEVFRAMFTSEFKEKKMAEIPLPDKTFDEFLQLMQILHPPHTTCVHDTNVAYLLPLSHEYLIHHVVEQCEKVLVKQPPSFHNLILADQFYLPDLRKVFFDHLRQVPYRSLEELEKESEIEMVNQDTHVELIQHTLMFQGPSIENLFLAEKYDVPEVYMKCLQYLRDIPLAQLQQERGFTDLKADTLIELLKNKYR